MGFEGCQPGDEAALASRGKSRNADAVNERYFLYFLSSFLLFLSKSRGP